MEGPMNTCIKELSPLFNKDFDPYELMKQLAANQEGIAEQTAHNSWMIEQLSEQLTNVANALNIIHDRLVKMEEQNEKD